MNYVTKILFFLLLLSRLEAQQTVIDYQNWNTYPANCNVFSAQINVPSTINGSQSSLTHLTNIGQPTYSSINSAIALMCSINNFAQYFGTQYQINHNFQPGYTYTIKINASVSTSSPTGATLVINLNNGGNGSNTLCNGAQTIDPATSGNLIRSINITKNNFNEYTFQNIPPQVNPFSVLTVAAKTTPASAYIASIYIRKITIIASPSTPLFTLSPSPTIEIPIGSSQTKVFTVNNVYNSPGTQSFLWYLGSSPNGLIYQGNPAPQSITTNNNSLTLTSSNCNTLNPVTVTPVLNSVNYPTLSCSVTRPIPPIDSFYISGPNEFCSNATYTIGGNSLCGATVNWSLGYLNNDPNVGQLSCTTCPTTTLNKIHNGSVKLIATITFPNSTTYTYENLIGVGSPVIRGWYNSPTNILQPLNPSSKFQQNWNDACYTTLISTNMDITANSNIVWENAGSSGGVTWYQNGTNLNFYFSDLNHYAYFRVTATNTCGSNSYLYRFRSVSDGCSNSSMLRVSVSPNPATSYLNVSLTDLNDTKSIKEIKKIRIIDKTGNEKLDINYKLNGKSDIKQIDISNLKPDIYSIIVWGSTGLKIEKFIKY
jgi:hypothetical protein